MAIVPRLAAILMAVALPAASAAAAAAPPTYKGRSASEWTEELVRGSIAASRELSEPAGKEAVPVLAELLGSDVSRIRSVAAAGLASIGGDAIVPLVDPLGRALSDESLNVRYFAARALGAMGPAAASAVTALIAALDTHPSRQPGLEGPPRYYGDARLLAVNALAAIGPAAKAAIPKLREVAANDDASDVRTAAGEALRKIEEK
jgi:HEAT repeat protein